MNTDEGSFQEKLIGAIKFLPIEMLNLISNYFKQKFKKHQADSMKLCKQNFYR